jgi:uncharacterized protein YciI
MTCFVVSRQAGPAWVDGKSAFDQTGADEHTVFMGALEKEGLVLVAGPLAGTAHGRIRVLVVVEAADEAQIHRRLADDPWVVSRHLVTTGVEAWTPLFGADRLSNPSRGADVG